MLFSRDSVVTLQDLHVLGSAHYLEKASMSDEFTHHILRTVVGRVCQPLGVHGMQQSVCDCMADVLKQYILTLGKTAGSYSAHGKPGNERYYNVLHAVNCSS